jgi:hypothetical protein
MEVSGQLHAPAALPPGKCLLYSLDRLGETQSRSSYGGEEKNDLRETGWGGGVDLMQLTEYRGQWQAVVNTVMNLRIPQKAESL